MSTNIPDCSVCGELLYHFDVGSRYINHLFSIEVRSVRPYQTSNYITSAATAISASVWILQQDLEPVIFNPLQEHVALLQLNVEI